MNKTKKILRFVAKLIGGTIILLNLCLSGGFQDQMVGSTVELPNDEANPSKPIVVLDKIWTEHKIKKAALEYWQSDDLEKLPDLARAYKDEIESKIASLSLEDNLVNLEGEIPADRKSLSNEIIEVRDSMGVDITAYIIEELYEKKIARNIFMPDKANAASVADNFSFALGVATENKTALLEAYPKIEAIYGKRWLQAVADLALQTSLGKIKVVQKSPERMKIFCGAAWAAACYAPALNQITLAPPSAQTKVVAMHELVHAFHGPLALDKPYWEEGFAVTASEHHYPGSNGTDYRFNYSELLNLPFRDFGENYYVSTSGNNSMPYFMGGATFTKVLMDNPNFFVDFNTKFYADLVQAFKDKKWNPTFKKAILINDPYFLKLAIAAAPTVEDLRSEEWFVTQFGTIFDYQSMGSIYAMASNLLAKWDSVLINHSAKTAYTIYYTYPIKDYTLALYDYSGKLLGSKIIRNKPCGKYRICESIGFFDFLVKAENYSLFKEYEGQVILKITVNNNPKDTRVQYFVKTNDDAMAKSKEYNYGVVIGGGETAMILDNETSSIVAYDLPIKNGVFKYEDEVIGLPGDLHKKRSGRFLAKVEKKTIDCEKGSCAAKTSGVFHSFNKIHSGYITVINTEQPNCCNTLFSCQSYCGGTVTWKDGGKYYPMSRYWGPSDPAKGNTDGLKSVDRLYYHKSVPGWGVYKYQDYRD